MCSLARLYCTEQLWCISFYTISAKYQTLTVYTENVQGFLWGGGGGGLKHYFMLIKKRFV